MMKRMNIGRAAALGRVLLFVACASIASFGTLATPSAISSISVSGGVATVTTSVAHNLVANNAGFCIVGSAQAQDNICGTATVTDSTHFTVNSSTMVACASSCGTSQPAPLFVLRGQQPSFGVITASGCMWTFVANGIPAPNAVSACSSILPSAIQSEVNGAIASGQWIEQSISRPYPGNVSLPTIDNDLLALQLAYQNAQAAASAPGGIAGKQCDVTGCN